MLIKSNHFSLDLAKDYRSNPAARLEADSGLSDMHYKDYLVDVNCRSMFFRELDRYLDDPESKIEQVEGALYITLVYGFRGSRFELNVHDH